jgi:hypothetical protein
MFSPLGTNLSDIKDQDLETKIQELSKKYWTAYRLGKPEMLTQISTYITIYKEELTSRNLRRSKTELDGDLDQLINVD